jgi:diphthamide biosynthesis enzyme Dph1/Dph2-like protein
MKTLYIQAKNEKDILPFIKKINLKGKIGLVSTIQYLNQIQKIKLKNFIIAGQVTGCNISKPKKIENKVDFFLFVGSEQFQPIYLAINTKKPVYILNPTTEKFSKITQEQITTYKNKIRGKQLKFLNANKIGILISNKPGQYKLKRALQLKNKYKNSFLFLTNNINQQEFENFSDIDIFINTACPRLEYKKVINYLDIPS